MPSSSSSSRSSNSSSGKATRRQKIVKKYHKKPHIEEVRIQPIKKTTVTKVEAKPVKKPFLNNTKLIKTLEKMDDSLSDKNVPKLKKNKDSMSSSSSSPVEVTIDHQGNISTGFRGLLPPPAPGTEVRKHDMRVVGKKDKEGRKMCPCCCQGKQEKEKNKGKVFAIDAMHNCKGDSWSSSSLARIAGHVEKIIAVNTVTPLPTKPVPSLSKLMAFKSMHESPEESAFKVPPTFTIAEGDILQHIHTRIIIDVILVPITISERVYFDLIEMHDGRKTVASSMHLRMYMNDMRIRRGRRPVYFKGQVYWPLALLTKNPKNLLERIHECRSAVNDAWLLEGIRWGARTDLQAKPNLRKIVHDHLCSTGGGGADGAGNNAGDGSGSGDGEDGGGGGADAATHNTGSINSGGLNLQMSLKGPGKSGSTDFTHLPGQHIVPLPPTPPLAQEHEHPLLMWFGEIFIYQLVKLWNVESDNQGHWFNKFIYHANKFGISGSKLGGGSVLDATSNAVAGGGGGGGSSKKPPSFSTTEENSVLGQSQNNRYNGNIDQLLMSSTATATATTTKTTNRQYNDKESNVNNRDRDPTLTSSTNIISSSVLSSESIPKLPKKRKIVKRRKAKSSSRTIDSFSETCATSQILLSCE